MKPFIRGSVGFIAIVSAINAVGQVILYDNLAPANWTAAYPSANGIPDEIGDEITLASNTPRTIDTFSVQYFGQGLAGTEQIRVRLYIPDGLQNDQGASTPGTLLYDSGSIPVTALNGRGVLTLNNLSQPVPDTIVWTVQFFGVTGNASAGLAINGPPATGTSYNDYWEKTTGNWELYEFTNPPQPGSFGAQITAVPEPRDYTLLAGTTLVGFAVIRRICRDSGCAEGPGRV
jgi:hypothetical protein